MFLSLLFFLVGKMIKDHLHYVSKRNISFIIASIVAKQEYQRKLHRSAYGPVTRFTPPPHVTKVISPHYAEAKDT